MVMHRHWKKNTQSLKSQFMQKKLNWMSIGNSLQIGWVEYAVEDHGVHCNYVIARQFYQQDATGNEDVTIRNRIWALVISPHLSHNVILALFENWFALFWKLQQLKIAIIFAHFYKDLYEKLRKKPFRIKWWVKSPISLAPTLFLYPWYAGV